MMEDLSEAIAELAYSDPEAAARLEAKRKEVEEFGSLREHMGWQRLRSRFTTQRDSWVADLGKRVAAGHVLNQREIDYLRGWYDAGLYLLRYPEVAEETLTRSASIAVAMRLGGEEGVYELSESVHL